MKTPRRKLVPHGRYGLIVQERARYPKSDRARMRGMLSHIFNRGPFEHRRLADVFRWNNLKDAERAYEKVRLWAVRNRKYVKGLELWLAPVGSETRRLLRASRLAKPSVRGGAICATAVKP
jgi:hypothetical protein